MSQQARLLAKKALGPEFKLPTPMQQAAHGSCAFALCGTGSGDRIAGVLLVTNLVQCDALAQENMADNDRAAVN